MSAPDLLRCRILHGDVKAGLYLQCTLPGMHEGEHTFAVKAGLLAELAALRKVADAARKLKTRLLDLCDGAQLNQCPNDPPCSEDEPLDTDEWCGVCLMVHDIKAALDELDSSSRVGRVSLHGHRARREAQEAAEMSAKLPEGMHARVWARIVRLPNVPTEKHPLGLRTAVLERAAMKRVSGIPYRQADREALFEEAGIEIGDEEERNGDEV